MAVAIIFVVQLVVVGLTSNYIIADEATRSTRHMLHGTISEIELPLGEVEIATRTVAALIASMPETSGATTIIRRTVEVDTLICGGSAIFPSAEGAEATMSYEDSNGVLRTYPRMGGWDDSSWVNHCIALAEQYKAPFWVEPYKAEGERDKYVTSFCYPLYSVRDGDSSLIAIVSSELPIDWIERKCESMRPYPSSLTTILSGNTLIGLHDSQLIAQIQTELEKDKELQAVQDDMKNGIDSIRRIGKGRNVGFIVYGPLHNGWMASVVCQYKEVLHHSSLMHTNLLIIGLIVLIILYFICRLVINRLTTPITQLSDAAIRMAKGDFNTTLPQINSGDEMTHLRDSFLFMQRSISEYIKELKTTTAANERMESELNVARNIQMGMLRTDFPDNVSALLIPAKQVGGDLYDYVQKGDYLYFAIGDVSGKGVPASLMMAITRAALRFIAGIEQTMDKVLERVNVSVSDTNSNNMFVTIFMGRINLKTNHLEYCNAGHNPIIVIPPDGEPYYLKSKPNLAIGLFEDFEYEAESIDLAAGTRLILYTDGVNEAERADKSLFGNDRLLAWAGSSLVRNTATSNKEVVEDLYKAVGDFTEGNEQNDDITIMSINV